MPIRHPGSYRRRRSPVRWVVFLMLAGLVALPSAVAIAGTGSITGTTFHDPNRDGVRQPSEPVLADQLIYLFDSFGHYVANSRSDATGTYSFSGLAIGIYRVEYAATSWVPLRDDWVPTTTGSIHPEVTVTVIGSARVDFGWREIVRSRDLTAPISAFVGPNGLRVESFNDVVAAREIYDTLMVGTVGAEAPFVTVRFDYSESSNTAISYQGSPGSFRSYRATCYNNWISWVTKGDSGLFHEYGHAWSLYYDLIVRQDGQLSSYLRARGLEGDERVNSSYTWSARELIAEDYRQLLASDNASQAPQLNSELPPASSVEGLLEFLLTTFTVPSITEIAPPTATVSPEPTEARPSPTADLGPSPTVTAAPTATPGESATPTITPTATPIFTESPPSATPTPDPSPFATAEPLQVTAPTVNPAPVLNSATFSAEVSGPATVTVEIRTARGQLVRTLLSGAQAGPGSVAATWDRKDERGKRVKAGEYLAVVVAVDLSGTVIRSQAVFRAT